MKIPKKQFPVERLFILGAGASFSATKRPNEKSVEQAPLDKNLCQRITSLKYTNPKWVKSSVEFIVNKWIDQIDINNYGMEEAVAKQLAHVDFIKSIDTHKRQYCCEASDYSRHLTHLITFLFRRKIKENSYLIYKKFAESVFPVNFNECMDRVITFNYDDLLDRYLISRFNIEKVYFDRLKRNKTENLRRRRTNCNQPLILKLHGSINWRCNKDYFDRIIDARVRYSEEDNYDTPLWCEFKTIPSPEEGNSPLIIPPLPAKPLSSIGIFGWLWTKAYEYLHQAKHIIVCGYSIPTVDQFAQSLFSNFSSERLEKITIVDPDANVINKWQGLLVRKNIPNPLNWQWERDFSDFVLNHL